MFWRLLILLALTWTGRSAQSTVALGGLTAQLPAEWKSTPLPPGSMRAGQWTVPAVKGSAEPGELTAFYFGAGQGGDVTSNLNRWISQFSKPDGSPAEGDIHTAVVRDLKVTRLQIFGTFASGMPGQKLTPRPGYALVGAIVESPQGKVFFKLTGPEPLIQANREKFDQFLGTLQTKPVAASS